MTFQHTRELNTLDGGHRTAARGDKFYTARRENGKNKMLSCSTMSELYIVFDSDFYKRWVIHPENMHDACYRMSVRERFFKYESHRKPIQISAHQRAPHESWWWKYHVLMKLLMVTNYYI